MYVGPQGSNVDEAITTFDCGISLRPGQAQPLAAGIRHLMQEPRLHQQFRTRAREAFETAYCDLRTLPSFDAILENLICPSSICDNP